MSDSDEGGSHTRAIVVIAIALGIGAASFFFLNPFGAPSPSNKGQALTLSMTLNEVGGTQSATFTSSGGNVGDTIIVSWLGSNSGTICQGQVQQGGTMTCSAALVYSACGSGPSIASIVATDQAPPTTESNILHVAVC